MERGEELYSALGQLVRAARRQAGLTQDALAMRVGLTRASINNIEHGRQKILVHTLFDLAGALGIAPAALLPPLAAEHHLSRADLTDLPPDLDADERAWVRAVLALEPGANHEQ